MNALSGGRSSSWIVSQTTTQRMNVKLKGYFNAIFFSSTVHYCCCFLFFSGWHFPAFLSKHLWASHSPTVSCQLSSGSVCCQGPHEVLRAAAQRLRLLQHAAEEVVPSTGYPALWRTRGPVCGSEEHQPHCSEEVCVIGPTKFLIQKTKKKLFYLVLLTVLQRFCHLKKYAKWPKVFLK